MKKAKLLVFALIVGALLLSGCGGDTAPKEDATGSDAGGEKVELIYWSMWNESEPQAITMRSIIEKFEAANPNITLSVVWNGRENQTKVRTALGANTPIDLVDQDEDQIAGGLVYEGMAIPVDDILNSTALDADAPLKEMFSPGVLDVYAQDGVHYLFPYANQPIMFSYNKDIFAEVGVEPPETWDEFLTVAQKIQDAGYVPIASEGNVNDYAMYYFTYLIQRMKGAGFLRNAIEDKTGASWEDPVFLEALLMIRDLWDKGYIPEVSAGYGWPAGQQTLATGKAAMELCGGWLPEELNPIVQGSFEWGGFRFPTVSGGVGGINDLTTWLFAFVILKDAPHPEEAAEFLKFMMTKDVQAEFATGATYGVTHKDVDWPADEADHHDAAVNAEVVFTHADGGVAYHAEYTNNVLFKNYLPAYVGSMSPEDFISAMVEDSKAYWSNK